MAGSLGRRSWRVRKLEGLARGRERPPLSPTKQEPRAIDAEIREIKRSCAHSVWTPTRGITPTIWRTFRSKGK
jgi:hypothetical protein